MNLSFTQYLLDFYGPNGIYDFGFTASEINLATQLYKCRSPEIFPGDEFQGDSVDRERVRDIILRFRHDPGGCIMKINYELTTWGNRETGEMHYMVDGMEVTKNEYYRCWKESQ